MKVFVLQAGFDNGNAVYYPHSGLLPVSVAATIRGR
jgi:hypothetical protein